MLLSARYFRSGPAGNAAVIERVSGDERAASRLRCCFCGLVPEPGEYIEQ
jgi:hypothetical protein